MSIVFTYGHNLRLIDTWRSMWPANELRRRGFDAYYLGEQGEQRTTGWAYRDTVVLHMTCQDVGLSGTVRYLRRIGARVFVNADDDYTNLGHVQEVRDAVDRPVHPEAGDLSVMGWFGQLKADHVQGIREADGLIAATPGVADAYGRWANRTWVIRNYLPRRITELPPRRITPPVAGWFGDLRAHRRDIEWLGTDAKRISRFGVVGDPEGVEEATGATLVYRKPLQAWQPLYRKEIPRFSVGVVPVVWDDFNVSKSWIKPLEFAAAGAPVVCSRLPEYIEAADRGLPLAFADDGEAMAEQADRWLHNPPDYPMREIARERFTLEGPGGDEWQAWAEEVRAA